MESAVLGTAMMFSSTIIGLKLLPTTVLHHQHMGEVVISVLLFQDLLAIGALLMMQSMAATETPLTRIQHIVVALPMLIACGYIFERFIFGRLLQRFDTIREYVFLIAVGWCMAMAELAHGLGLSREIGAFIAGVAVAAHPVSFFISESLKPVRDFFLIMFFFALGAGFDPRFIPELAVPAGLLALAILVIKPHIFKSLLTRTGEPAASALEIGVRLGQASEFSLLIAVAALASGIIGNDMARLIQLTTLFTFIGSSSYIGIRYPTPIATSARLRRD